MPYSMLSALERADFEVIDLGRFESGLAVRRDLVGRAMRMVARQFDRAMALVARDEISNWNSRGDAMARVYRELCGRRARTLALRIEHQRPDVVFGNCISSPLAYLESKAPIVYTSDATAEIIAKSYPSYTALGPSYAEVTGMIEREALARVRFAGFACPATLTSAVSTYGVPEDRAVLTPFGANLLPPDDQSPTLPRDAPSRTNLRLCITAVDPVRKRIELAMEATKELRERGWNASLTLVGPLPSDLRLNEPDSALGFLDPADCEHQARHRRAIDTSHIALQPSLGEAYGIAPIEAAAFGRPSVVSDVGGLPFVVQDGVTGRVVPVAAGAAEFADAIESIAADPERYRQMSVEAHARYRRELNWDQWATRVGELLRRAAAESRGGGS